MNYEQNGCRMSEYTDTLLKMTSQYLIFYHLSKDNSMMCELLVS